MATTDHRLALASLEGMREAGVRFALLHGGERLASGQVSDVDLVVGDDPPAVVRRVAAPWAARGLVPVVLWPYDIGGTATVFLATPDATEGVQLDLLFDPDGVGKYGIRSSALLASADPTTGLPMVSATAGLIYLWQKRVAKADPAQLDELTRVARTADSRELVAVSEIVTGSAAAAHQLLAGQPVLRIRHRKHPLRQGIRATRRVAKPVGFWTHAAEADTAIELARRCARFLVCSGTAPTPSPIRQPAWWIASIQPVRLRPGVFLSHGPLPRWPAPDLVLSASSADEAARQLTAAMNARLPSMKALPGSGNGGSLA
jgi:hypothetical protein